MTLLKRYAPLLIPCIFIVIYLALAWLYIPGPEARAMAVEGALVERTGDIFLGIAVLIGIYVAFVQKHHTWRWYPFFMLLALARELSFHKAFTTMGIFKSRFYVSADVPVIEKLFGAVVIFILLYAVVRVARYFVPMLKQSYQGVTYSLFIFTAMGFSAVAKFMDGFFRFFPSMEVYRALLDNHMVFAEESLETASYLLFLLAPLAYLRHKKKR